MFSKKLVSAVFAALFASAALAGSDARSEDAARFQRESIQLDTAPIHTRDDLLRYLADASESNPLNKLSPTARQSLLDTLTVNKLGVISSFRISDIRSELAPTDAYRVFTLFGTPYLAGHVNNGQISSATDAQIAAMPSLKGRIHPAQEGYYCNAGYCTKNDQMTCSGNGCKMDP